MQHVTSIHRCLELAAQSSYTGLNPKVGAVLVRNHHIVAEGYHHGWGMPHAEVDLLADIEVQPEDVLYVNLEPCCHTGKTPPCTDIIIQKGIKTVVYGMQDPNPKVAGQGIARLREAGIEVIGPVLPELCTRLNRGFVSVVDKGRPYITLKSAQTREGEFANPDGSKLKITSQAQDEWSHTNLRATHDAVLVGVQTVLSDDPQLTVRHSVQKMYSPYRIILDPDLRIALDAKVVTDEFVEKTIIVTTNSNQEYAEVLEKRGVTFWEVPRVDGLLNLAKLWEHCLHTTEDFHGISSILVEGGPTTWAAFRVTGYRDEEVSLVGSKKLY